MTENKQPRLSFREGLVARLAWPVSARHFGPWHSECISMTTMFVHTALLFGPILSVQGAHLLYLPGNDMDYKKNDRLKNIFHCI